jgi:ribosomal protein S21
MKVKVEQKDRENFSRMIRRFNNAVQRSQILTDAKENSSHQKEPNKREQKEEKLRRMKIDKEKREY